MNDQSSAGILTRMAQAWDRFWFQPANPTTLGLMRICTGVLVLYIHLVYTPDLGDLFGANAWLSLNRADELRKDSPWIGAAKTWDGFAPSLQLPEDTALPGERSVRDSLLDFLRSVPDDARGRRQVINWILQPDDAPVGKVPAYVRNLPPGPPEGWNPPKEWDPRVDVNWQRQPTKWQLIHFIHGLPESKAERDAVLAYMKKWTFDPRQLEHRGGTYWSVWFHVTDPAWMMATHLFILGVIVCFTLGLGTRVTAALTWFAAVSYVQRSPISLFGGDTMMMILLLYLAIGPSGAALSLDRWLAHWWRVRKARGQGLPEPEQTPVQPLVSANFAIRLIQIHFCIIYFASGTSKLLGGNWWNGTAIYFTMANYEFAPLRYQFYLSGMRALAQHRWLWEIFMTGGSFFTLALEIGFPYLVWNRRLRPFLVAASMSLHIGIALTMGLVAFSLLMATMVLSFIPGDSIQRVLERLQSARASRRPALPTHRNKAPLAAPAPEPVLQGASDAVTEKAPKDAE